MFIMINILHSGDENYCNTISLFTLIIRVAVRQLLLQLFVGGHFVWTQHRRPRRGVHVVVAHHALHVHAWVAAVVVCAQHLQVRAGRPRLPLRLSLSRLSWSLLHGAPSGLETCSLSANRIGRLLALSLGLVCCHVRNIPTRLPVYHVRVLVRLQHSSAGIHHVLLRVQLVTLSLMVVRRKLAGLGLKGICLGTRHFSWLGDHCLSAWLTEHLLFTWVRHHAMA